VSLLALPPQPCKTTVEQLQLEGLSSLPRPSRPHLPPLRRFPPLPRLPRLQRPRIFGPADLARQQLLRYRCERFSLAHRGSLMHLTAASSVQASRLITTTRAGFSCNPRRR